MGHSCPGHGRRTADGDHDRFIRPTTHQRHHLDLYASDQQAEVERLLSLGAQRVDWRYPEGADYIVLADPDGNRFCVVQKEMEQTGVANPSA
uniref:VOC family protein n=1 Tax=Rhizobium laguerreae TaxID=1076926 RepID=UPI001FEA3F10|nr:VOC family protein [Rhizobium laguerreae]